jgi:hypothetical protein
MLVAQTGAARARQRARREAEGVGDGAEEIQGFGLATKQMKKQGR